jgi:hypothetical protein
LALDDIRVRENVRDLRLVLPTSKRGYPIRWGSRSDHVAKALRKLAGPHLPATLRKLEQAVKRANSDYDKAVTTPRTAAASQPPDSDDGDQAPEIEERDDGDGDSDVEPEPTQIGG